MSPWFWGAQGKEDAVVICENIEVAFLFLNGVHDCLLLKWIL
jgi:hypothetical protein